MAVRFDGDLSGVAPAAAGELAVDAACEPPPSEARLADPSMETPTTGVAGPLELLPLAPEGAGEGAAEADGDAPGLPLLGLGLGYLIWLPSAS